MRDVSAKQSHDSKTDVSSHQAEHAHPMPMSGHPFLKLQRTIGNQAVMRLLQHDSVNRLPLQPKLAINVPGDAYEQEADRVAEQVMRMPDPQAAPAPGVSGRPAGVQRKCACGGTCDDCKKKHPEDEHARVQMKAAGPATGGIEAPPIVHEVLSSPGQPLDATTRAFIEPRFGRDFSKVRVHTDEKAAESANAVQAKAYTVGQNVVFGAGAFAPGAEAGQRLLAHELTHVVQQKGARCATVQRQPTPDAGISPDGGTPIKDTETKLGEDLIAKAPEGVSVAFYGQQPDANEEAMKRAVDWAVAHDAIGPSGTKIKADQMKFGQAISDSLALGKTITDMSTVMKAAVAKATPPGKTPPEKPAKVKNLAIFAHGTSDWCGLGAGITSSTAKATVKAIAPAATTDLTMLMFTCNSARGTAETEDWAKSTLHGAKGEGSIASELRNAMVEEKISQGSVWGHTTTGHVSRNFALRFFSAASGKDSAGSAYAGDMVWPPTKRAELAAQLETSAVALGYVMEGDAAKGFRAQAVAKIESEIYQCYAKASETKMPSGLTLAESAPTKTDEVTKLLRDYWDKNCWTKANQDAWAEKVAKMAKLKKAAPGK